MLVNRAATFGQIDVATLKIIRNRTDAFSCYFENRNGLIQLL